MQWKITNAALALTLLWSAQTMAELYRYVDDKGVTVLDSRVPPKFISRGYEVLDAHGRVKLVVPGASPSFTFRNFAPITVCPSALTSTALKYSFEARLTTVVSA